MSKFLNLCEEFDPAATGDPKWDLVDFLKSKGINASIVRDTDMIYIDTGAQTIAVTVSNNEEEAEGIDAGFGEYEINKEVENLGAKAASGLKGTAAKLFGTNAQKAKAAVAKRQQVAGQAVGAYTQATKRLQDGINQAKRVAVRPRINV